MKSSGLFSALVGAALIGDVAAALAPPSGPRREPVALQTSPRLEREEAAQGIEHKFKLPQGFAFHLVAAEPDVANPMTMCVDEQGALWVTEAHTYRWGTNGSPFQPPTNPIKRIELGPDGRAAKTIVAAEGFPEPVIGVCT